MRNRILLLALLTASAAYGAKVPVTKSVDIILIRSEHRSKPFKMTLSSNSEGKLWCQTEATPRHRVEIEGLTSLAPPFKNAKKIAPACERTIQWGSAKRCFHPGDSSVVDEVIHWCTNF